MKLLQRISLCALSLFIVTSCGDSENSIGSKADYTRYAALEKSLTSDYSALISGLRSRGANLHDESSVTSVASQHFGESTAQFGVFIDSYKNVKYNYNSRVASDLTLTATQSEKIEEILASINSFNSSVGFKLYLENQFDQIAKSNISIEDKDFLLTYVTSFKVTLNFLESNQDLVAAENINGKVSKEDSWWSSWGKCAAGIVGSAVTTGATLGLGGAVVGTVALPVVGTVSGAVVGAVAGAIGGALVGAATFCD